MPDKAPLSLSDPAFLSKYEGPAKLPAYSRSDVQAGIVHFGAGGFHRAHQAAYLDDLFGLDGSGEWGIIGVGTTPADARMNEVLGSQGGLYSVLERGAGHVRARVVGSLKRHLLAPRAPALVLAALTDPSTRIVTLTVTEGGYFTNPTDGSFRFDDPSLVADSRTDGWPTTWLGFVVRALVERREHGTPPFTVLSCDNLQGNGTVARRSVVSYAGLVGAETAEWIEADVAFPNSMVDRITPRTAAGDRTEMRDVFGIDDGWPVTCEPFRQWVVEDRFPAGRPALERVGVQFVPDVTPYELMKLRLLNASHQALGYFGFLAGYTYVHEALADPLFRRLLLRYMEREASPTLGDLPGIDLDGYRKTVIERFSNPALNDTMARMCLETSTTIPTFLLPVVHDQLARGGEVTLAAAIVASWARYAEGVDETGAPIEVVDRRKAELMPRAARQRHDPVAFIRANPLFAGLDDDPRFVEPYVAALRSLHEVGSLRTLERLVGDEVP